MPARPAFRRLAHDVDASDEDTRRVAPDEMARTLRAVARLLADEQRAESSSNDR